MGDKSMKLNANVVALLAALEMLTKVIERKNTIPVLALVLMRANGNSLTLSGTDLDQTLECDIPARVEVEGSCAVSARQLLAMMSAIGGGELSLIENDSKLLVRQGELEYSMFASSPDSVPESRSFGATPLEIDSATLRGLIERTKFAITHAEGRYTLSGAKTLINESGLTMITTDGHRLAFASVSGPKAESPVDVLIPRKALTVIAELSNLCDVVSFGFDEDRLFLKAGGFRLGARLLSGQFPSYEAVIPKAPVRTVGANSAKLLAALKRVTVMADDRTHYLHLAFGASSVVVTAEDACEGRARDTVETIGDGEAMTLAFNGRYLSEFLKAAGGDVQIELTDESTQVRMRPASLNGLAEYYYILMPCR